MSESASHHANQSLVNNVVASRIANTICLPNLGDTHMKIVFLTAVSLLISAVNPREASGAPFNCGTPPPLADESMRLGIGANAQLVTKNIGGGAKFDLEKQRADVLSKYPNADRALADAFFNYEVCAIVMNDGSLTSAQKLERIENARRMFAAPIARLNLKPYNGPSRTVGAATSPTASVAPPVPSLSVNGGNSGTVIGGNVGVYNAGTIPLARRQYLPKLQEFYARGEGLYLASKSPALSDSDVDLRFNEFNTWADDASTWMANNMTPAAAAKFVNWHIVFGVSYTLSGTHAPDENKRYSALNIVLPQLLDNLQFLMTSDAMDPQQPVTATTK